MKINTFQIFGLGFPPEKANEVSETNETLQKDFLTRLDYSEEILRLEIASHICEKKRHISFPKPRFAKAKTYKSTMGGWPDQHFPPSLEVKVYVDMDVAQNSSGTALRHALIDPVCVCLLDTPKTVQKQIDIPRLIADLNSWADGSLPETDLR